ncbi:D-aminoacyl-tRNA deacylase [Mechercharimyces sp. CAU 1602]|uniref:D-aminoacyl-tRNA deacylase n=1 Tax=Mechercharimyces sp. CAU 1602 TaxID=2973933 RepID=UPI0021627C26|nr:D-aminoacyl-tRNA deacylase [Mechercharimyces sp. CAU 1602]MCS1350246.1 D-aminoacyl-tRNA deacylase [Mechercharimyces sp. CAU 1602]
MRVLLQRVTEAKVTVQNETVGSIQQGLLLLIGVTHGDEAQDVEYLADKVVHLRIFTDEEGKMNRSLLDIGGAALCVSQFTLYGDCLKGRRPNFMEAASPQEAEVLYEQFNERLRSFGVHVENGQFGQMMEVSLTNDGPVTLMLESHRGQRG